MNADQIPGGKKERKQTRKIYYNRKRANSHSIDRVYRSNLEPNNTMKSEDILALKIHGLYNGNDSFSSDSGQSSFDEDYYKYKPQPLKIDRNRIIVIETKTNTKQRFNAKHKTDRDLALCKENLGMRNHEKSSNGNTLISPIINVGEIKADDEIKKDNGDKTGRISPIYYYGQNKKKLYVLAKNHIEQRRNTNEIKPRSPVVSTSQSPNNKWTFPKSTEVLSNSDPNYARYPSQRGEVVIPDVAKTQLLSSIASIDSRQPKNKAQTNTSFSNDFGQAYYYYGASIQYLETAAVKVPIIKTSEGEKTSDETLKNTPVTQGKHKTVISSRQQLKPDLIKPCYVGPVHECWQFPSNNERQPSWPKIKTQTFKSSANISEQTAQLENSSRKILDEMLKSTPGSQEEPKTVLNSKQRGSQVQQLKPGPANPYNVSSVPKCWQFPPSEDRHSSLSKNETQTDNSFAHTEISHIKSSQGKKTSNHILNKPPASQTRNKIDISERENASKTNQHVPKKDSWDEQGPKTIHMVRNNETLPLVRRISPKNYTESNILTGFTRIPQGSNILRPDQSDVIVKQPRALPIVQTTQWSSAAVDEHAEDEDDKPEEIRKGCFALLFCCCSRT